jgi:hypothetical protein
MYVSHKYSRLSLLALLCSQSGCIGMRTPLDDASGPSGNGSDATAVACGNTITIDTTPAQPDVLILLDRSASMKWSLTSDTYCTADEPDCSSRSEAMVSALDAILTDNPKINWGLELFPNPDDSSNCSVSSTPQVGISSTSASAIQSQLAAFTTSLTTPTAATIDAATAYLKKLKDGKSKAILLATDGLPNCPSGQNWYTEDMAGATDAATSAKKAGFPLYVIGIGPSVSNLNGLAEAGGTGSYYPVTSTTALSNALKSIAAAVSLTCTFKASKTPPDTELTTVYVDQELVVKNDSNGWKFDPTDSTYSTIVLTGSYCQKLLAGATSQVQIVSGCPGASSPNLMP